MNEIKKCSIAGVSFTLERNAYDTLSEYLKSLHATYKDDPDGEEIIADIEARIAELILSTQTADAIIAKPLIDNIIKQLGSAEEIDEEASERHAETEDKNGNPRIPRRLFRDLDNGKLGGVCAGIARYFDTDPTWIRLAVFLPLIATPLFSSMHIFNWLAPFSSNLFGLIVLGYLIMWFSVPPATSARQKLEMTGERITASSIRSTTQAAARDERERSIIAKLVAAFGRFLLICVKTFTLLILTGLVCGASVLALVAITTTPAIMAESAITGFALGAFFIVITMPIVALIYLSVMLLISRRPNGKAMLVMFLIWLFALCGMIVSAIKSPVKFDRQVQNAFESVFENDEEVLFEEFTEEEITEFRQQFEDVEVASRTNDNLTVTIQGPSDDVQQMESTIKLNEKGLTITDGEGKLVEVNANGITVDGEKIINYTTEVNNSEENPSQAVIFSVGDVKIRFEEGLAKIAEQAHSEIIKGWNEAMEGYKDGVREAKKEINAAAKEIKKEAEKLNQ
jgi:phage shock protein PspC (stress-responsive transcriptional regulator)/ABC-type transport system involved in multi-copper enzyme maturation permease subunit